MTRPPRALRFVSAQLEHLDEGRCRGHVELAHPDRGPCVGSVEGVCEEPDGLALVARATADAILRAVGNAGDTMTVAGTTIAETFGTRSVFVKVDADYGGQHRALLGFCLIETDPARAAGLAVLNATNRFLAIG